VGNFFDGTISVIDTATNTVVASIAATTFPTLMHVTPDGKRLYITDEFLNTVVAIDTATNAVVATISIGGEEVFGLAPTKDNKKIYVGTFGSNTVSIIDRATNNVVPPLITVGTNPVGMEFTPDGKFLYVANFGDNTVSVISTATNGVVATIPVGGGPLGLDITDLTIPFASFRVNALVITPREFIETGNFTLGARSKGIDPVNTPVKLTVGSFSLTIPAGKFVKIDGTPNYIFNGTIRGMTVQFILTGTTPAGRSFNYVVDVTGANILPQPNPVKTSLTIGNNSGSATVRYF
jgi:YVTN family beta-propeller protein